MADPEALLSMEEDGTLSELPLFAGDEAKAIFSEIQKKREDLEKGATENEDHEERLKVMLEHLKNVRQEVQHTTGLVAAKRTEIRGEEHAAELAKREAGRYEQELRRERAELEEHDAMLNSVQNKVFAANEAMDGFKLQMNWNQEELEQWALASKQKEEDNLAIQRYARADEVKINALSLQIEKLTKRDLAARAAVEAEQTETSSRQIELDRTAQEFRALHAERQTLVRQWRDAVEAAARRDRDITEAAAAYVEEKRAKEVKVADLRSARESLKGTREGHGELQAEVTARERQVQARREALLGEKDQHQRLEDEIDVLKSELASSARALIRRRKENERAAEEVVQRRAHLERCRKLYHAAKAKFAAATDATAGTEDDAANAEKELKEAEAAEVARQRALAQLKEKMFRASQALFALRQREANYIAEISGAQAQTKNLQSKIRVLDGESVRQQELIYNAEFQIQQMERKVARGQGERSDDEKRALGKQITEHESRLAAARDQKKMLVAQCRRLNNELRQAQRREAEAIQAKEAMAARITELDLESNSAEQSLKTAVKEGEEAMVQNDVMRLELKRLRDALGQRADKVFTLENRKQQLRLSMSERKREIAVHRDVQAAQLRLAEEERHKAKIEVGQRLQQVNKLAAKYETLCKSSRLRGPEGEGDGGGGEPKSQAYYLIQAAQKREELQRQGDELDQEIRRREREMRALEATLHHVNRRNSKYRQSFQKANMKSTEAEDMKQLEEQAKLASDALFRRKKELQRLATDFEEDDRRLKQVETQCARIEERNAHLAEARAQMEVELSAQDDALASHADRLSRLSALHREKVEAYDETVQEKSFRAAGLRESTQSILRTLGELAKAYPELKDVLSAMLSEVGFSTELN